LEAIREKEEIHFNISSLEDKQNFHWYRTHELAHWFLRKYEFNLHINDVHHYFAHINSAKCCMNKPGRKMADPKLFDKCREFIPGEVAILEPDIIVTQGDKAKDSINGVFADLDIRNFLSLDQDYPEIQSVLINNVPVIWIHTYHPSNWGEYNNQRRNKFGKYTKAAFDFIRKTKG
jgi:hypothetical protein